MNREEAKALKQGDTVLHRSPNGHCEAWTIDYIIVRHDGKVRIDDVDGSVLETEVKNLK